MAMQVQGGEQPIQHGTITNLNLKDIPVKAAAVLATIFNSGQVQFVFLVCC